LEKLQAREPHRLELLPSNPLDPDYNLTHEEWSKECDRLIAEIRKELGEHK